MSPLTTALTKLTLRELFYSLAEPNNNTITISVTSKIMYMYYWHKCWPQCLKFTLTVRENKWKLLPENCYSYKTHSKEMDQSFSYETQRYNFHASLFLKREQNFSFCVSWQNPILVAEKSASSGECHCANLQLFNLFFCSSTFLWLMYCSKHNTWSQYCYHNHTTNVTRCYRVVNVTLMSLSTTWCGKAFAALVALVWHISMKWPVMM